MKAIHVKKFGGPDVLDVTDIPIPQPGPEELLVRIHAAGLNPIDAKTRRGSGFAAELLSNKLPYTPGYEFSGTVAGRGERISEFNTGDEVYGMAGLPDRPSAYAEYTTATPDEIWYKPKNISHETAAGVPLAALTAWQALNRAAKVNKGMRILVHAAAGGVGHFAVQFAKLAGAYVIGTASERNHSWLFSKTGMDECIDYTKVRFEERIKDIDLVIDTIGAETGIRSFSVLKKGGVLVTLPTITADTVIAAARERGIDARGMIVQRDRPDLQEISNLINNGYIHVKIDSVWQLEDASKAHEKLESGHAQGKVILSLNT